MSTTRPLTAPSGISRHLAQLVLANIAPSTEEHERARATGMARMAAATINDRRPEPVTLPMAGALAGAPKEFGPIDKHAAARLRQLDAQLTPIGQAFPAMESDIQQCRLTCAMLEGAWHERIHGPRTAPDPTCTCALCVLLPVPPRRDVHDYQWRRSDGRPLTVKIWPYRTELDSVLTAGWVWLRKVNDHEVDLNLRDRYADDILAFHEYKRVMNAVDVEQAARSSYESLNGTFDVNGARALVSGLFASHKRTVDEYWIRRHQAGISRIRPASPFDVATYTLLQLFDCLLWHFSPDIERWQDKILADLVLSRVLDDLVDVRADAVTGEIGNLWLTPIPTHDKALHAACAMAAIKYGCMPEAHGQLWNSWLLNLTVVWMGLAGRHALWFDGITNGFPAAEHCPLCGVQPNPGTGLLSGGVTLHIGPQPTTLSLSPAAQRLSERCRTEHPQVWPLFHTELAAFEALHGSWQGNSDNTWTILRRTYIAAVLACLDGGSKQAARDIQIDSGVVGADQFHLLNQFPAGLEDTALLSYLFGCAHPHFLWNCLGHRNTTVRGDWLDG